MSSNDSYPPSGQAGPDGEAVGLTSWQPAQPDPYASPAPAPQWAAPAQPWSAAAPVPAPAPPTPDHQVPNPYGTPSYGTPTYGTAAYGSPTFGAPTGTPGYGTPTGAPAYGSPTGAPSYGTPSYGTPSYGAPGYPAGPVYPAPPIGAPMYAPTPVVEPKNGMAVASFVVSLVMLAAGLFTGFYIGSFVVVWLGVAGLRKANALDAAGYGPRGRVLAWIGIAIGVVNLVIVWGLRFGAF
ncbi:hypothetical protein [Cellulomonas sp. NTE-D12]|uniref:DUF4190 domain-containing protein n=1 Tax=Cellulomonas sp. NTE-D12 TaxID=2962632 RepID=UPI003081C480|nr:hypothetical protein CELD12_04610 [Cellulomonas sp. NTE-D12]